MTISLITATYNSAATLDDTLASIARQNVPDLEVLIQDGGSTDATLEIAARYPFTEVASEPDNGLYDAMNKGIARAQGDIVGILNSDDFYAADDILATVRRAFAEEPALDAVYGSLQFVDPEDTGRVVRDWQSEPYRHDAWRRGWMPPHPTFFVRRSVYERFGGFNEQLRIAADYEFMLRCCYVNRIRVKRIPRTMVYMRAGGVSNSSVMNRLRVVWECTRAWPINGLRAPLLFPLLKPLRKWRQFTSTATVAPQ